MYPARQRRAITIATNITLQLDGKHKSVEWKIPVHGLLGTRTKLCEVEQETRPGSRARSLGYYLRHYGNPTLNNLP